MEKRKRVQIIYQDNSLTVSWSPSTVPIDLVIDAFDKLGSKMLEYFQGSSLYFVNSARRSVSIMEICEECVSPVFVIPRNTDIPFSQCFYDIRGKRFSLNEFADITENGDFYDTTEDVSDTKSEPLPKKKKVMLLVPNHEENRVIRIIPLSELKTHVTMASCWTSFQKKVYDITDFVNRHPGGAIVLQAAGKDCEALARQHHSWVDIQLHLKNYYIGDLAEDRSTFYRSSL